MRDRLLTVLLLALLAQGAFAQEFDAAQAERIALSFAGELYPQARTWHVETYVDSDGAAVIHEVALAKGRRSRPYRRELNALLSAEVIDHREDYYLTVLVGAERYLPPVVAYYDGLPAHLVTVARIARRIGPGASVDDMLIDGISYISPFSCYISLIIDGEARTFNMIDLSELRAEEIPSTIELPGEQAVANRRIWEKLLENDMAVGPPSRIRIGTDERIISGVADWNQPSGYPGSCGPTSAACALDYWDQRGYPNMHTGSQVAFIDELARATGWVANEGVTPADLERGTRNVCNAARYGRNYNFQVGRNTGITLNRYKSEIDRGTPFVYGSYDNPWGGGHAVCAVGYSGNYIIVHDNWPSTPRDYSVNWNSIGHFTDMVVYIRPPGSSAPRSVSSPANGATWQQGSRRTISWAGFSGRKVRIELYRGSTLVTTITSGTRNDGSYNWRIPASVPDDSNYRIKITSRSDSSEQAFSPGSFSIGSDGGGGGGGGTTDDHGDGRGSATQVGVPSSTSGRLERGADVDYFKFSASAGSTYTIYTGGSTDTYISLEDSGGRTLAQDDDSGDGLNARVRYSNSSGRTLYVKVRGYGSENTGAYTLAIQRSGDGGGSGTDDHADSRGGATQVGVPSSRSGSLERGGDVDYFKFSASAGYTYTIYTTGSTDTYIYLEGSSGWTLDQDDDSGDGLNASVSYFGWYNCTIYVKVCGYSSSTTGSYTLHVSRY